MTTNIPSARSAFDLTGVDTAEEKFQRSDAELGRVKVGTLTGFTESQDYKIELLIVQSCNPVIL
jgi:hypothetical protein